MHFNKLNLAPEFLNSLNGSRLISFVSKYLQYNWSVSWEPCPPLEQHMGQAFARGSYSLFGFNFMKLNVDIQNIGPTLSVINTNICFLGQIDCLFMISITPIGPMKNKVIHHFYTKSNLKALLFSKYIINGAAKQVINQHAHSFH